MFKMQPLYLLLSVLLISVNVFSQCPFNTKFGKIVPEDFSFHSSFIDSGNNAGAVILFDIGSNEFESNNVGGMRTVFNKHTRIKILNKNGYNAATVRNVLYRYSKEYEEDLINLKASTFILESNVVKEYKLDRKNDLNTNVTGNYFEDVFTLPSIKEGAIIEFSYTIKSDIYSNVHSWYFQGIYPVIYTQYSVLIPEFLKFNFDIKPFVDLDVTRKTEVFNIVFDTKAFRSYYTGQQTQDVFKWAGDAVETKWIGKNVPAIYNEPFLNNPSNYYTGVKFNFTEFNIPAWGGQRFSVSWKDIERRLKKSPTFGVELYAVHNWMKSKIAEITGDEKDTLKIVKVLYEYIRDHYNCIGNGGIFMRYDNTFKNIFNKKDGSESELNLLLISMLKQIKIEAYPILVSTKEHGFVNQTFPDLDNYNYLLCKVILSGHEYFLDVSNTNLGFNKLALDCYNDNGRQIEENNSLDCIFSADSLKENNKSFVYISNDDSGNLSASCKETYGYYKSFKFREDNINKPINKIVESIEKDYSGNVKIKDLLIDSFKLFDNPVSLQYFIDFDFKEDIIYFNPMMNQAIKENPFKSATRRFPVEMPYCEQLNYSFTMEVPKGYTIDEMPKSANVLLNEDEGLFEYKISAADNLIQLKCKLKFSKATYPAEDYQTLRDFYSIVVKKMNEQIVFKKVK